MIKFRAQESVSINHKTKIAPDIRFYENDRFVDICSGRVCNDMCSMSFIAIDKNLEYTQCLKQYLHLV